MDSDKNNFYLLFLNLKLYYHLNKLEQDKFKVKYKWSLIKKQIGNKYNLKNKIGKN